MATGIIAASGTLAQIIPPSLVLIVMADQLGKSVGDMYEGAFIPGLVLAGLYAVYAFLVTLIFPKAAPGLPTEAIGFRETDGSRGLWSLVVLVVLAGVVGLRAGSLMLTPKRMAPISSCSPCSSASCSRSSLRCLNWIIDKLTGFRFLSHDGAADDFRDGAAAVPDLPGAGHDLHRPRDTDRGRRHGRDRRDHSRRDASGG